MAESTPEAAQFPAELRAAEQYQAEKTIEAIERELQLAEAGSGTSTTGQVARELYADHVLPIRYQLDHTRLEREDLRTRLAAANERAQTAEAEAVNARSLIEEYHREADRADDRTFWMRAERDKLRARLDGLGEEWGYRHGEEGGEDGFDSERDARAMAHPGDTIMRRVIGPWLAAGGTVSSSLPLPDGAGPPSFIALPSRAEVHADWDATKAIRMRSSEAQAARFAAGGQFWADLNLRMRDPGFRDAYESTSAQIQALDDAANGDGPFRNGLRDQLVATGMAAAEQWLSTRANRKMSDVNRKRLVGHIINALWELIEQAAIETAEHIAADGDEHATHTPGQPEATADGPNTERTNN